MILSNHNRLLSTLFLASILFFIVHKSVLAETETISNSVHISAQVCDPALGCVVSALVNNTQPNVNSSGASNIPIATDNLSAKVYFSGTTDPDATISILQDSTLVLTLRADNSGSFLGTIRNLVGGNYLFSLYATNTQGIQSNTLAYPLNISNGTTVTINGITFQPFTSGVQNNLNNTATCNTIIGDLNCDGKVNLVDFSIMAYWFKKGGTPPTAVDLNRDGVITLTDFSILAYHWTG